MLQGNDAAIAAVLAQNVKGAGVQLRTLQVQFFAVFFLVLLSFFYSLFFLEEKEISFGGRAL